MTFPSRVAQLHEEIHSFIEASGLKNQLLHDQKRWGKLSSALDLLRDTQLALEAFLNLHPDIEVEDTKGDQYLAVYGALQALFLQQDALGHVHEVLEVPFSPDETLREIRDVRNDSVGHPSNRRGGQSFHYIGPFSISRRGFQLMSVPASGGPTFREIDLFALAARQNDSMGDALEELLKLLRERGAAAR